jgi:hypothetical protein
VSVAIANDNPFPVLHLSKRSRAPALRLA